MYIVFGYGSCGRRCVELIGKSRVAYVLDNDTSKCDGQACPPVYGFSEKQEEIKKSEYEVVVAVSEKYEAELIRQCTDAGITHYLTFHQLQKRMIKEKVTKSKDSLAVYKKAICWIHEHTVAGKGIENNTGLPLPYPEVTGYYIPTLLRWGYRHLAIQYAKWLCGVQKEDGSWYDTENHAPYVFDTAQVLKGLIAVHHLLPEVKLAVLRGCDWMLRNMMPDGRLTTPTKDVWGDVKTCSELVHVYFPSALKVLFH